jgi:UDP-N-acetylmuramate--alanine ligase
MQRASIHKVFFLGIGGIGMSALARYFRYAGAEVAGYDKTPTLLTEELQAEGIRITFVDSLETLMADADLVVYTPAIPAGHLQKQWYTEQGFAMKKRAEVLGLIANDLFNISVAGSHGKTSTSSLIAHILQSANKDVAAFLGGVCLNFNSNFIHGNTFAIAEADEFDRSFLQLKPNIALVTSVDTDHLDVYGNFEAIKDSFKAFLSGVRKGGNVLLHSSVDAAVVPEGLPFLRYALQDITADFHADRIRIEDGAYHFDMVAPEGIYKDFILHYGGRHNVENAVGACAVALIVGVHPEQIRQALATFKGVRRRFETHTRREDIVYIDDYAHHPREIDAAISAARQLYPGKKITVVFQPHLYSRTRDLAAEFAASLDQADELILLPVYPARELPIPGVGSELILSGVTRAHKALMPMNEVTAFLEAHTPEVLMTLGAGDIDTLVLPIRQWIENKRMAHE